jgi:hypothetical protein
MDGTSQLQWKLKQEQKVDTGIKITPTIPLAHLEKSSRIEDLELEF